MTVEPLFKCDRDGNAFCNNCDHHVLDHNLVCTVRACSCAFSRNLLCPHINGSLTARILDDGRLAVLYNLLSGKRINIGPLMDWNIGGDEIYDYRDWEIGEVDFYQRFRMWDGYGIPAEDLVYRYKIGQGDPATDDGWTRRVEPR